MYKHQVIGIRRERSFRSRKSRHIVSVCTLEALDENGSFHDFAPKEDWVVERGKVVLGGAIRPTPVAGCRSWALEEVVRALAATGPDGKPVHEFYTRHPKTGGKAKVFGRPWITTRGNRTPFDNLHAMREAPDLVACDVMQRCPVIPPAAAPVSRGHGPDC